MMKSIFSNSILILLARLLLGGLFIVSSLDKFADPGAFIASILNYKIIGTMPAMVTATILPSLELLCGMSLILGIYPRTSTALIVLMLIGFTLMVFSALWRGLDISCGCFTQDPTTDKIGYHKIFENLGMILLGIYLLFVSNFGITLLQFLPQQDKIPNDRT
jgi:uncharacterized membrane protein YphA (DoxX/SURF4 family)